MEPLPSDTSTNPMACKAAEEDYYKSIIMHKKELHSKKPTPVALQWMLDQCSEARSDGDDLDQGLFIRLPNNPKIPQFDRQNYQQWKAQYELQKFSHPFRMRRRSLLIQPLSYSSLQYPFCSIEPDVIIRLQQFCRAFFLGMDITIADSVDVSQMEKITKRTHSETGREQILVDDLMKYLRTHKRRNVFCVVGVAIVDLYPGPEWNFTLGHASLTEGVAVCSFGRYFNSQATSTQPVLQQQLRNIWVLTRVITHELCHVFGLSHCYYFRCCMNESSSIDQATQQPLFLCPVCLRKLKKVLKFDILERYKALAVQCLELDKVLSLVTEPSQHRNDCLPPTGGDSASLYFRNALNWLEKCMDKLSV